MRCVPIQFWPAAQKAPEMQPSTALSSLLSAMTITGALPPRSIASFFSPADRVIASPVVKPPVKETIRTSLADTMSRPRSAPPIATVTIPSGRPASASASTSLSAESGVSSEGFNTTALPPAIAGPSLWATRFSGSL
ncbi:hypothetical protein D9M72_535310 [compost metagenome]